VPLSLRRKLDTKVVITMSTTDTSQLVEIEAEICAIAASMATYRVRLLHLVGEIEATGGWRTAGHLSCAHWLAELLDIELSTAREKVRIARALRELPVVRRRFESGALSYAKVRQVTRVATPENEMELTDLAERHPAGQLPKLLAAWQQRREPDRARKRQHDERGLSFRDEPTGNRTAIIQLSAQQIAMLEALVDFEVLHEPAGASPPRSPLRHKRADAFGRLIERLATGDNASADASRTLRPELILHRRVGETRLQDGTLLPEPVARCFTCDADVRVMTHYPDGSPADVGRRHRVVTPRLRRIVLERDGYQCRFPGCQARHFLQVHHIVHWEDGGPTSVANLITYCGYHHRFVHHELEWFPATESG
jgi:hypothetical protein